MFYLTDSSIKSNSNMLSYIMLQHVEQVGGHSVPLRRRRGLAPIIRLLSRPGFINLFRNNLREYDE